MAAGRSVSVEVLLWVGVATGAALLRLVDLDGLPLTVDESRRALDAARVAGGEAPETWRGDLAAAATSYLFRVFGESEFVARLAPALGGAGLVSVLWSARGYIGRVGALVAAMLVGFSPLFVMQARSGAEFSIGAVVAITMVLSMLAYVRAPGAGPLFGLVISGSLALLTDAVAVSAFLAVGGFLAIESGVLGSKAVAEAWRSFRSSRVQWGSALLVVLAAFQLGLAHFGTTLNTDGLPGLRLWTDMFESGGAAREPEYYGALLLGYELPIVLGGGFGLVMAIRRVTGEWRGGKGAGGGVSIERMVLVWTVLSAMTLLLATRREPGQLVLVLLPLALLAGAAAEEAAGRVEWSAIRRHWPLLAAILGLMGYAALLMTEWSAGNGGGLERGLLVAAALALGELLLLTLRNWRGDAAVGIASMAVVATAFLGHSSLAVAFSGGTEFASDERLLPRAERLKETLDALAEQRDGEIVVDGELIDVLGWTLRDSPVVFGDATAETGVVVLPLGEEPDGFVALEEVWRVAEGWQPESILRPRSMWRWLLYRGAYSELQSVEVQIFVRSV